MGYRFDRANCSHVQDGERPEISPGANLRARHGSSDRRPRGLRIRQPEKTRGGTESELPEMPLACVEILMPMPKRNHVKITFYAPREFKESLDAERKSRKGMTTGRLIQEAFSFRTQVVRR